MPFLLNLIPLNDKTTKIRNTRIWGHKRAAPGLS